MNYSRLLVAIVVLFVACSSEIFESPIKKAVRDKLKDPDSAKFGEQFIFESRACISINAKNSYGGYTGASYAHLEKLSASNWYVHTLDGKECSDEVLRRQLAIDKANKNAEKVVLQKLKEKQLISLDVESTYSIKDKVCADFASEILTFTRLANDADGEKSREWQAKADQGLKTIESGVCK